MNRLVQEIIKNFLPEEEKKQTTALYAGGFKPPTAGHFAVVQEALKQNPEIDEFIIFVGSKERDGVSQEESLLIWEIYNKYLPFKVKIELSSLPPIKAVYDFAKNHPTREILWILGAREDNEQDFTDIGSRTKSITNYPNIEARTIITKGGVSGTAARNASKVSFEKFEPFLPSVLTPEEKKEVYQIVSGKMQENLDQPSDKTIIYPNFQGSDIAENPKGEVKVLKVSDSIGNEPGKDFNYFNTEKKSYIERMIKSVKEKGIESFSPVVALKHPLLPGKYLVVDGNHRLGAFKIGNIPEIKAIILNDSDIVLATPETEWEEGIVPETIDLKDAKNKGIDLKTYFNTKDLNIPKSNSLNENASYSQHIDIKQKIKELTQHMIDKGMNIVPLPKVIFKHGDAENAKQFLGKTAYYKPKTMEIVLYTEGRHPKDIVRSFSHEMIHHIQNLEGRIGTGDIKTTNTNEDDYLEGIEREAYEEGNITFRNWSDSLREKKSKDPFGLNAYAMELARLREEETEYTIYCDMDSVLVDFDRGYQELTGMTSQQADANGVEAFWDPLSKAGAKFWITLQWMSDGKQLWDYIKKYNPILLSAPSREESSKLGKRVWVKRELPGVKLILKYASQKQEYASPTSILIDDRQKNIDQWKAAGGIGILHTNTANTIKQLKQLGL
jgi:hypothetical protein